MPTQRYLMWYIVDYTLFHLWQKATGDCCWWYSDACCCYCVDAVMLYYDWWYATTDLLKEDAVPTTFPIVDLMPPYRYCYCSQFVPRYNCYWHYHDDHCYTILLPDAGITTAFLLICCYCTDDDYLDLIPPWCYYRWYRTYHLGIWLPDSPWWEGLVGHCLWWDCCDHYDRYAPMPVGNCCYPILPPTHSYIANCCYYYLDDVLDVVVVLCLFCFICSLGDTITIITTLPCHCSWYVVMKLLWPCPYHTQFSFPLPVWWALITFVTVPIWGLLRWVLWC